MTFFDIVKKSLARYRMNPVLILPPLVMMMFSLITSFMMVTPSVSPTSQGFAPELLTLALVAFGVLFLNLIISFLVLLGQASMTGKVVLEGKTRLSDWGRGIKRYTLRVLGIGLIYVGIVMVFFMFVMLISMFVILPQFISQLGKVTPSQALQISPLTSMTIGSVTALLTTIASAIFYIWLAPAVIDDKGVSASLQAGTEAIGKSGKTFLGFIALFLSVSLVPVLIGATPTYFGTTVQPASLSYVTPTLIVSQVVTTIFSPLWFLMAFTIYSEQKAVT